MSNRVIKPGEILKEEFMIPINLSAEDLSFRAKIPLSTLFVILKGEVVIDKVIERKLARYFKTSEGFWMNLGGLKLNPGDFEKFYQSIKKDSEPNESLINAKVLASKLINRKK